MHGKSPASEQQRSDRERTRAVLRERMGLDTDTVGPFFLDSILDASTRESGYSTAKEFLDATKKSHTAWQVLVRHATVAETWFFRDRKPFAHFAAEVRRLCEPQPSSPVRVLSYPCASGEESYSMRIALDQAGIQAELCTIDGADISKTALSMARAGLYFERSFRGCSESFRHDHFTLEADGGYRLLPRHGKGVCFEEANLLEPFGLEREYRYEIVFCRNLLIYLGEEARRRLLSELEQRMQPGALLVVGHAEAGIAREAGYLGEGDPAAFAFRRCAVEPRIRLPHSAGRKKATPASELSCYDKERIEATPAQQPEPASESLEEIRCAADGGAVERALMACQRYLALHPAEAEAHYLFGVLLSSQSRVQEAEQAYRKALYLDPTHAEAKLHLGLSRSAKHSEPAKPKRQLRSETVGERRRP